jgi:hypothetical protein
MSSVSIQGNASGTGIFTIASPNSNTNRTLTLPDNTGTILTGSSSITASQLPAGSVLQVVVSNPAPNHVALGTSSWTEVSSAFRASITPINASSTLIITCTFIFGGNFSSNITHLKIYNITNSADVNLHTGNGSRTPMHGAARQVDHDINDVDVVTISTTVSASTTSARTYGLYAKNETGTTTKYFFGTSSDAAAIPIVRPLFTIYEIAP